MKNIILGTLVLIVCLTSGLMSQQRMQYSQYLMNSYLINPAVGGAENYYDLKAGFSQQWVGFEGAPRGLYISLNKGLYGDEKTEEIPVNSTLPVRGRGRVSPTGGLLKKKSGGNLGGSTENFHAGIGGTIFSEKTGPISYNGVSGTFAGHIRIQDELKLSVGAGLEFLNYRLDPTSIQLLYDNDVAVSSSQASLLLPSINAGFALYSKSFFVTGATRQLLRNRVQVNSQNPFIAGLEIHYIASAGYRIPVGETLTLLPSATLRFISPAPVSFDLSLRAAYQDLFFVGLSYRHKDAVVGMVGYNLNNIMRLQYGYDFTISNLSNYSSGTHSLVLAIRLGFKESAGRRYFW